MAVKPRNDSSKTVRLMRDLSDSMRLARIGDELRFSLFEFLEAHIELKSLGQGTSMIFHTSHEQDGSFAIVYVYDRRGLPV